MNRVYAQEVRCSDDVLLAFRLFCACFTRTFLQDAEHLITQGKTGCAILTVRLPVQMIDSHSSPWGSSGRSVSSKLMEQASLNSAKNCILLIPSGPAIKHPTP